AMLRGCHGEFHDFVLEAAYGRILARPGLPPLERELLACAALAAQDQERQFVAHARGARTFGASLDDLAATLAAAGCEPNTAARWLRAVR
ncbi:MAG: Carboxymuconolactone decarboxylase family, partial [Planctomycetota bacterium]